MITNQISIVSDCVLREVTCNTLFQTLTFTQILSTQNTYIKTHTIINTPVSIPPAAENIPFVCSFRSFFAPAVSS